MLNLYEPKRLIYMEIILPTSWNQIKVRQWADIQDILTSDINIIHKNNRILAVLSNTPLIEIENLTFKKSSELSNKITAWINNIPNQLITEFKIKDVTYVFNYDMVNITTGQYADFSEFLKKDGYYKYAECAAVLCVPKGEKYNSDLVAGRASLFWDEMTMDILYPMSDFFLRLLKECLPHLKTSLSKMSKEIEKIKEEILMDLE